MRMFIIPINTTLVNEYMFYTQFYKITYLGMYNDKVEYIIK